MANLNGQKANLTGQPMRVDGNSVDIWDKVVLTGVSPATADVVRFRIPGGSRVMRLRLLFDDLDTGAALVFSVGYAAVDPASSLAANATYFAAAGQTTGQAGGAFESVAKPIKFEEDVYVTITVGTGGAGSNTGKEIHMIASVNQEGIK